MNGRWETFSRQTTTHAKLNSLSSFPSFSSFKEDRDKAVWESSVFIFHKQVGYRQGKAKREKALSRSCLTLAWHQHRPTRHSALAGHQWLTQARWVPEHHSPQTDEKKSLLEPTQNKIGILHKITKQHQLKGLIRTSAFLSMSDFRGTFLFWLYFCLFNMLNLDVFWTWNFFSE